MKILARLFFCTLVTVFFSCEPEEMPEPAASLSEEINPGDIYGDTGNQGDVNDEKEEP